MSLAHYCGAVLVVLLIACAGVWSGHKVKSSSDFEKCGGRAGVGIVAGCIIGSLVGGASTIGTAQLAFTHGLSAWWFTLGAGLGCIVLGCGFARPLRNSGSITISGIIAKEYGPLAGTCTAILSSLGNFLTIAAQVLSGMAVITAISPLSPLGAVSLIIVLMLCYVMFGGVWGAGTVGMIKTALLALCLLGGAALALYLQNGPGDFFKLLPASQYFSLVARGATIDLSAGLALIVGVVTTQTYVQTVISARSLQVSRNVLFGCSLFIPLIGLAGICIGLYMRLHYPEINPAGALPLFILREFPPLVAGMLLATLLVTVLGTGAGIALGVSSMLCRDVYQTIINRKADDRRLLLVSRLTLALVLGSTFLVTAGNTGSLILDWSYLAMGLRGAVAFFPLCAALFLPGKISARYVFTAIILAPLSLLLGKAILSAAIDPLFPAMGLALAVIAMGLIVRAGRRR